MTRRILLTLHKYIGLVAGGFVFVLSVTGCVLVFEEQIDRALSPGLFDVSTPTTRMPLQALADMVRAAYPDRKVLHVRLPRKANGPVVVALSGRLAVFVDPFAGRILGERSAPARLVIITGQLHSGRIAGTWGRVIVGVATVLTLFLVLSGLYLWWPRKILLVRWRATWRRISFDTHSVLGIYSAPFLVFTLVSGIVLSYEGVLAPVLAGPGPASRSAPPQSTVVPGARALTLDEAVAASDRALPGAETVGLDVAPSGGRAAFKVLKRFPEDMTGGGRSHVFLDQYSGRALLVQSSRDVPVVTAILDRIDPIHVGNIFGWPSSVVAFLACLALAGQVVTGVLIWWKPGKKPPAAH